MIEPEVATRWRSEGGYDRLAAVLIGIVAILAAVFATMQAHEGTGGTRAQVMAARLTVVASAQIGAGATVRAAALIAQQGAVESALEATSRQLQGTIAGDDIAVAVGTAEASAVERLNVAIAETTATSGGEPLDAYAAGLVTVGDAAIVALVEEQNRQVDIADEAGRRELLSVLGLSLVALAGVLAGISAVLGRGKAGWLLLGIAWVVAAVAAAPALGWLLV